MTRLVGEGEIHRHAIDHESVMGSDSMVGVLSTTTISTTITIMKPRATPKYPRHSCLFGKEGGGGSAGADASAGASDRGRGPAAGDSASLFASALGRGGRPILMLFRPECW